MPHYEGSGNFVIVNSFREIVGKQDSSFQLAPKSPVQPVSEAFNGQESRSYMKSLIGDNSKVRPFPCHCCSRTFNCRQAVNAHLSTVHKKVRKSQS